MKIYVFGNPDLAEDAVALNIANQLKPFRPDLEWIEVGLNQDLPFADQSEVWILDVVMGIDQVTLIDQSQLDQVKAPPRTSVHDYDLGFQLKLLKKLGHLGQVTIIGLPYGQSFGLEAILSKLPKKP